MLVWQQHERARRLQQHSWLDCEERSYWRQRDCGSLERSDEIDQGLRPTHVGFEGAELEAEDLLRAFGFGAG